MKRLMMAAMVVALTAMSVQASVTFSPSLKNAKNESGVNLADGTVVMLLDLDNDGLNGRPYTSQPPLGSMDTSTLWMWDENDSVLFIGGIGASAGLSAGRAYPFAQIDPWSLAGYTPNVTQCWVLWFDLPYSAARMGPGENVAYGAILAGLAPNDGGTMTAILSAGSTTMRTVMIPEPATMGLLGLGLVGLFLRQRRDAKA